MNKIDKRIYKALKYLSSHSTIEICNSLLDKNKKEKFRKYVSGDMDRSLQSHGYIVFDPKANNIVTLKGLEYLRNLEAIKMKERTLSISIIAIIISVLALLKSFNFFGLFG